MSTATSRPLNFLVGFHCRESPTGKYGPHFQIRSSILPLPSTKNWKIWQPLDKRHQATNWRKTTSDFICKNDLLICIYKRLGQGQIGTDGNFVDVRVWTRPTALYICFPNWFYWLNTYFKLTCFSKYSLLKWPADRQCNMRKDYDPTFRTKLWKPASGSSSTLPCHNFLTEQQCLPSFLSVFWLTRTQWRKDCKFKGKHETNCRTCTGV